jgi:hypothetical protein
VDDAGKTLMSVFPPAALMDALARHERGELSQAAQPYQQIVSADPANASVLHLRICLGWFAHKSDSRAKPANCWEINQNLSPDFPAMTRLRMFLLA